MKQKRLPGVNFHRLWRESGEALSQNSNRLTLMLAIMVALSPLPICRALLAVRSALLTYLPEREPLIWGGVALMMLCLTLFFALPLAVGLLRMAGEMEQGSAAPLQDVFWAFADRQTYRVSLRISFSALWRILLLAGAEIALYRLVLFFSKGAVAILMLGIPLYLGAFIVWYLFAMRGFLHAFVALRTPSAPARMQPYARSVAVHYAMGFFPWIVLSLLTLGVLLLADVLPRMLIAYFRLCKELNEITTRSEELINE